jgi:hypothetical protein
LISGDLLIYYYPSARPHVTQLVTRRALCPPSRIPSLLRNCFAQATCTLYEQQSWATSELQFLPPLNLRISRLFLIQASLLLVLAIDKSGQTINAAAPTHRQRPPPFSPSNLPPSHSSLTPSARPLKKNLIHQPPSSHSHGQSCQPLTFFFIYLSHTWRTAHSRHRV